MVTKCWSTIEAFPTLLTFEWLLSGVDLLVSLQTWFLNSWIPSHTHHTYSVFLLCECSDECGALSCKRSFSCTHNMDENSLLSSTVDEDQTWRNHQIILYTHFLGKGLWPVWVIDSPAPTWSSESPCLGGTENFLSWNLDIWLSHWQFVARSASRKFLCFSLWNSFHLLLDLASSKDKECRDLDKWILCPVSSRF